MSVANWKRVPFAAGGMVSADHPPPRMPFMYFANAGSDINLIFMDRDIGYRYYAKVPEAEHLDCLARSPVEASS